jgi:serine/threonine-protein kinase
MTLVAGRLRLLEVVGTGAGGPAWHAWDVVSRRHVVVQHLPEPAETVRLGHPHLLVPDLWLEGRLAVSRLVRGGSAERLLASHGALPVDYVAVLLDQLLGALAALHDAGWVHGDVKPGNLLLEPTGTRRPHLRLGDLGEARRTAALGPAGGTPGYVAPEVRTGGSARPSQDLYAVGVTAAELLSGRVPSAQHPLRRSRLRPLVVALTDPDPARRPADAQQARTLLRTLGVPEGTPWRQQPGPPEVPDRFVGGLRRPRQRL